MHSITRAGESVILAHWNCKVQNACQRRRATVVAAAYTQHTSIRFVILSYPFSVRTVPYLSRACFLLRESWVLYNRPLRTYMHTDRQTDRRTDPAARNDSPFTRSKVLLPVLIVWYFVPPEEGSFGDWPCSVACLNGFWHTVVRVVVVMWIMYKTSDYVNHCIRCMYTCIKKSTHVCVYVCISLHTLLWVCSTSHHHRRLAPPALWDEVSAHLSKWKLMWILRDDMIIWSVIIIREVAYLAAAISQCTYVFASVF